MASLVYIEQTASYFAQVIDKPWIVKQERLNELQEYMQASTSVDFQLSSFQDDQGEPSRIGRLFSLPFRLSLGLHESVQPRIDETITIALYDVYQSTEPLNPKPKGVTLKTQQKERTEAAIGGALIEAAYDRTYGSLLLDGLEFARHRKLISFANGMTIRETVKLLQRS